MKMEIDVDDTLNFFIGYHYIFEYADEIDIDNIMNDFL